MKFLLDTCALSETVRPRPDFGLVDWLTQQNEDDLFVSTLTLGELRQGIERLPAGKKKHELLLWLTQLSASYGTRFLVFDADCAITWGILCAEAERGGRPLPVIDAMLAATASRYECTLVTRNTRDYENTPIHLFNPWSSSDSDA